MIVSSLALSSAATGANLAASSASEPLASASAQY